MHRARPLPSGFWCSHTRTLQLLRPESSSRAAPAETVWVAPPLQATLMFPPGGELFRYRMKLLTLFACEITRIGPAAIAFDAPPDALADGDAAKAPAGIVSVASKIPAARIALRIMADTPPWLPAGLRSTAQAHDNQTTAVVHAPSTRRPRAVGHLNSLLGMGSSLLARLSNRTSTDREASAASGNVCPGDKAALPDACFVAQQGGQCHGDGGGAVKPVRGEPAGYVGGVPVQEFRAARIGDHVDDLGQVDHDKAPVVDQQVVGGHVAVRQPMAGERDQGLHE